jgi:PAS domain S-box-containing protein
MQPHAFAGRVTAPARSPGKVPARSVAAKRRWPAPKKAIAPAIAQPGTVVRPAEFCMALKNDKPQSTQSHPVTGNHSDSLSRDPESKVQRERYRVFIEDVADGFYETDLKGNFLYFNDALCRIFGYPRDRIRDRNFREFMDSDNAAAARKHFNRIYRTGKGITDIVWKIRRKDGRKRIIELSANLILDDTGKRSGFRGIVRDVTEQHRARQEALQSEQLAQCQYEASRKAEQRYRAFLNFLPEPVFVFNLDSTVSYLNPAFEKTFGWTLPELEGKRIPFVPESHREQTREGVQRLFREKVIHNFETKRLTKDGRLLDIVIDGALFYDGDGHPAGQVVTLRDVTEKRRIERINQALFRVARVLPHYRRLEELLAFITGEIRQLLEVESASVILLDEEKQEFFFFAITHDDTETGKKFQEIRFPVDKGVAGQVYRTGQPLIVHDTANDPYIFRRVDEEAGFHTRNMLDVPIQLQDRLIGVLCAVNKKYGSFDSDDVDLLGAMASTVALPIENTRINTELQRSYDEVQSLNRAKDQVIHRLSHELKTPLSVLSASLELLDKNRRDMAVSSLDRILQRSRRNLQRLLDMQYEIEDILRQRDYRSHALLSVLLDACTDELESLAEMEGCAGIAERIRVCVDDLFGPREATPETIRLDRFTADLLARLRPHFAHRRLQIDTHFEPTANILIPPDVLRKMVEGLIRNAVENTPDGSRIAIDVRPSADGPRLIIRDWGTGISAENQRLIFENYFTATDAMQYSTGKRYDFNAGGRGFDLLRMKIFSERYHFQIHLQSEPCDSVSDDEERCAGEVQQCPRSRTEKECRATGGTQVAVTFPPAETLQE